MARVYCVATTMATHAVIAASATQPEELGGTQGSVTEYRFQYQVQSFFLMAGSGRRRIAGSLNPCLSDLTVSTIPFYLRVAC